MKELVLREAGMRIAFRIREEDQTVELVDFSAETETPERTLRQTEGQWTDLAAPDPKDLPILPMQGQNADGHAAHQVIALQVTGQSSLDGTHGGKHAGGSDSPYLQYVGYDLVREDADGRPLTDNPSDIPGSRRHLTLRLRSRISPLEAEYHMLLFPGVAMVRTWAVVRNIGDVPIGIDYISSFLYTGLGHGHRCAQPGSSADSGNRKDPCALSNSANDPDCRPEHLPGAPSPVCSAAGLPPYEKLRVCVPRNSWDSETQWSVQNIEKLGVTRMPMEGFSLPDMGTDRYAYGSIGSWSTGSHLPIAMAEDPETGELWYGQIEHSGSWRIEYGSFWGRNVYIALMGPDNESEWWKELAPGESFTTVPAGFGVCRKETQPAEMFPCGIDESKARSALSCPSAGEATDSGCRPSHASSGSRKTQSVSCNPDRSVPDAGFSAAFDQLTRYRRAIRETSADDGRRTVVFNDYMNCLFGDPTEERELPMIDLAAQMGAECYCIDAGWYDDGPWWNRIGEWKEAPGRFPNGLKKVIDYIGQKGMRAGLWIEIEAMGTACPLAQQLPDDWFICRHGRRRVDCARYLLDFRNPEVRQYCTGVIDRLIADYGVSYFKIDYNVTTGAGSDRGADSPGQALLEHVRCLHDWIREQYARHPGLIIENCGSGAQRMDYGMLSLHSLQSTSDNTDYQTNVLVASNIATAVAPEQAGQWVYPYRDEREHVIYCMVGGLLLRPYLSGNVWAMSQENLALMKEGVDLYKTVLRNALADMVPFWPLGLHSLESGVLAFGMRKDSCDFSPAEASGKTDDDRTGKSSCGRLLAWLAVFFVRQSEAAVPLSMLLPDRREHAPLSARVIYPASEDCRYRIDDSVLTAAVDAPARARLFEIRI